MKVMTFVMEVHGEPKESQTLQNLFESFTEDKVVDGVKVYASSNRDEIAVVEAYEDGEWEDE